MENTKQTTGDGMKWFTRTKMMIAGIALVVALVIAGSATGFYFLGHHHGEQDARGRQEYRVVEADVHHIYMTFGTLPTLFASLHMLTHNHPTYALFTRRDTFNISAMPDHIQLVRPLFAYGNVPNADIITAAYEVIRDIEAYNDEPTFRFFTDDLRALLPLWAFLRNGIPAERFHITLLSDGGGSYGVMFNPFLGANGLTQWNARRTSLNDTWMPLFKGNANLSSDQINTIMFSDYGYQVAQMVNAELWLQFPEFGFLHPDVTAAVRSELMRTSLVKRQPFDILQQLNTEMREVFFNATLNNPNHPGGSVREHLENYLSDPERPVLIISGTHIGGGVNPNDFDDAVYAVMNAFPDYEIMIKPHPAQDVNASMFDTTRARGLTILPAQLPMEVLMWAFPHVYIGGYQSSLYMAAVTGQVRFFFSDQWPSGGLGAPNSILHLLNEHGFFHDSIMINR